MQLYYECIPDHAFVKREGKWIRLDTPSIVPGDIIKVGSSDRLPADIRVLEVSSAQ